MAKASLPSISVKESDLSDALSFISRTAASEVITIWHKGDGTLHFFVANAEGTMLFSCSVTEEHGSLGEMQISTAVFGKLLSSRSKADVTLTRNENVLKVTNKKIRADLVLINGADSEEENDFAPLASFEKRVDANKWLALDSSVLELLSLGVRRTSLATYMGEEHEDTFILSSEKNKLHVAFFDNYHAAWFYTEKGTLNVGNELLMPKPLIDKVFRAGKGGIAPSHIALGESEFWVKGDNYTGAFPYLQPASETSRLDALRGLIENFLSLFEVEVKKTVLTESMEKLGAVYDTNSAIKFSVSTKSDTPKLQAKISSHYGSASVSLPCILSSSKKAELSFEVDYSIFTDVVNLATENKEGKIRLAIISTNPEEKVQGSLVQISTSDLNGSQVLLCSLVS